MFELERLLQKRGHIHHPIDGGTILISWFPHETDKYPIADIAETDTGYPAHYDGYRFNGEFYPCMEVDSGHNWNLYGQN